MSASWYDVLGIDREAGSEEIRAAWKSSIADLDPTDRRFALYNEAAGVLLDPRERSAYDESLPAAIDLRKTSEPDAPSAAGDVVDDEPSDEESAHGAAAVAGESSVGDGTVSDTAGTADTADTADGSRPDGRGDGVPLKLLALLAAALLVVAAVAAVLHFTFDDPADVEDAIGEARRAAETSVPKVVAYDYKRPEASHDQAMRVLTGDLKTEYDTVWNDAVAPNLEKSKATLTSTVAATGAVRASADADRVEVLAVLQVHAVNADGTQDALVSVTVTMVNRDGTWLIEEIDGWDPALAEEPTESPAPSESPNGSAPAPTDTPASEAPTTGSAPSN